MVQASQDGSYLVFDGPASGQVVLLERTVPQDLPALLLCCAGAAALLMAALLVRRRKRKRVSAGTN